MDIYKKLRTTSLKSGEKRIKNVGKYKILVSRDIYLDKSGNPVYRASVINSDNSIEKSYRSNGGYQYAVEGALDKYLKSKRRGK